MLDNYEQLAAQWVREFEALEAENTALKARVMELELVMLEEFTSHPHTCDAWGSPPKGDCNCDAQIAVEVLSRKPAASLLLHNADVLDGLARKILASRKYMDSMYVSSITCIGFSKFIFDQSKALRKQAGEMS